MTMESRLGLVCRVRGKVGSRGALSSSGGTHHAAPRTEKPMANAMPNAANM